MATAFNKNYTELSNVNSGNQLQNGDDILGNHVNVALQNTAHFKELTNNTVIRSASLSNNTIHLVLASKSNTGNVVTTNLNIDISNLDGVKQNVTSGGYTSTIYNGGDIVAFSTGDSNDVVYTFRLTSSGAFELEQNIYDPDSGTSTVSTYQLRKYPCFVKITHSVSGAEVYITTISDTIISSYSSLLNRIPYGVSIQASGEIPFPVGELSEGHWLVISISAYNNYVEFHCIKYNNGSYVSTNIQIPSSQLTITGNIKVF